MIVGQHEGRRQGYSVLTNVGEEATVHAAQVDVDRAANKPASPGPAFGNSSSVSSLVLSPACRCAERSSATDLPNKARCRQALFNPVKPCTDPNYSASNRQELCAIFRGVRLVFWSETDTVDPDSPADLVVEFLARGPRDPHDQ